ncbi:MAG: hypothetical protein OEM07_04020 [Gammaproteobacteria bacterium]|nr:hypothetical protein [Gammaproteobacteria bacterium]
MRIFFSCLLLFFGVFFNAILMANPTNDCDPVVKLEQPVTGLQKSLSALAKQYRFELNFPVNADQSVDSVEGMRLSQAIKYLTADVNTVLQYEKIEGCEKARLISMEVLPIGEEGEYVHVASQPEVESLPQDPVQPEADPVYIDDMAQYVEDVLLNKRERDRSLSPQQQQEFSQLRRQVKARLEAEGLLEPKKSRKKDKIRDRKKPGKKNQQEQVDQSL